ncbi:hypothetical protein HK098_004983 [Nowakowskiella sp. JEL0407]|nr:hypothetical protein HK098_004983 [Nowakowskiella sp. JEL0407]
MAASYQMAQTTTPEPHSKFLHVPALSLLKFDSPRRFPKNLDFKFSLPPSAIIPSALVKNFEINSKNGKITTFLPLQPPQSLNCQLEKLPKVSDLKLQKFPYSIIEKEYNHNVHAQPVPVITLNLQFSKGEPVFETVSKRVIEELFRILKLPEFEGVYVSPELSIALVVAEINKEIERLGVEAQDEETEAYLRSLSPENMKKNAESLADKYRKTTSKFNTTSVENKFVKAFTYIVNSTQYASVFDTILQLEKSYAEASEDMREQHEQSINKLKEQHSEEMHDLIDSHRSNTSKEPNPATSKVQSTVSKHLEEMEFTIASLNSQLDLLHQTQKQEYREFIIKVYQEMLLQTEKNGGEEATNAIVDGLLSTISPSVASETNGVTPPVSGRSSPSGRTSPSGRSSPVGNNVRRIPSFSQLKTGSLGNVLGLYRNISSGSSSPQSSPKFKKFTSFIGSNIASFTSSNNNNNSSGNNNNGNTIKTSSTDNDPSESPTTPLKPDPIVINAVGKLSRAPSRDLLKLSGTLNMDDAVNPENTSPSLSGTPQWAEEGYTQKLKEIEEMGFTTKQAQSALEVTSGNVENAVALLLENQSV